MISMTDPAVTPSEAAAYLTAAGATDLPDAQAIVRGQRYVAARWNGKWIAGMDPLPDAVKHAIIEAAAIEARTPGFFARTYTPDQAKVLTEAKGFKWTLLGNGDMTPVSTTIDGLLSAYVQSASGGVTWLARA